MDHKNENVNMFDLIAYRIKFIPHPKVPINPHYGPSLSTQSLECSCLCKGAARQLDEHTKLAPAHLTCRS